MSENFPKAPNGHSKNEQEQRKIQSAIEDAIPLNVSYANLIVVFSKMLSSFVRLQFKEE